MMNAPLIAVVRQLPLTVDDQLQALFEENLRHGVFPAVMLAVLQGGKWLFHGGRGWLDPDTHRPLDADSLFDLASITKLYTTTACLALLSAGKATLQTPLVAILPEFGAINPRALDGGQDPHSKQPLPLDPTVNVASIDPTQVTLWHLLTHTSGLPAWRDVYTMTGDGSTPPPAPDLPDQLTRQARWQNALAALCRYPCVDSIGRQVRYSDVGLMLLGEAVARLHGSGDLEQAITELVLTPLKAENTLFNPIGSGRVGKERCVPTEFDPTWRKRRAWGEVHDENACGVGGVAGHAGLFATAQDLALFGQAWLANPALFGITPELAHAAKQEHAATNGMRRGLGFALKAHEGAMAGDLLSANTYGHSGFTGTTLWIDPTAELVIVLLTNSVYAGREKEGTYEFRRAVHTLLAQALL
jgi:CubicO group peptidase (beta-lactamase class C family)